MKNDEQLKATCERFLSYPTNCGSISVPIGKGDNIDYDLIDINELQALATAYLEQAAMLEASNGTPLPQRDWVEDYDSADDNGFYYHTCTPCGESFGGHKRRGGACKVCWIQFATQVVVEHNRQIMADAAITKEQNERNDK